MTDLSAMSDRWNALQERVAQACQSSQRDPSDVSVLPISKTFPVEAIRAAQALGFTRFGENRMQEIRDKAQAMGDAAPKWVVIGPVQTNKARDVARYAAELHTLDRLELAQALARRLDVEQRTLEVLVQVKTAAEESKHGMAAEDLIPFLKTLSTQYPALRVKGLMTVATQSDDEQTVRACFRQLRALRDAARAEAIAGVSLDRLSMGMSGDYAWAIAEGATEIRIGSALFGDRSYT